MEMNNSRPSLNAYPMPPSTLYLPGLAALLNPLKFKNSPIYEVSTVSPVPIVPPKSIVTPTSTVSPILCNQSLTPSTPTLSGTRTVRCRNCLGCQSPPCGKCGYCKDSLQFGGPGVKKQTCIERKCVALIESRIQKDPTPVKNRPVCNNCEGCKQPDCQSCLVCYDKK
uniref:CXXC-type domain-containing protein n=1 Tax=Panagrolaimus davidi TaxID=227884 RepID=A0A914QWI3_9BILA